MMEVMTNIAIVCLDVVLITATATALIMVGIFLKDVIKDEVRK